MGKPEDEYSLSTPPAAEVSEQNAINRCRIRPFIGFRCIVALLLGVAVLVSAIFWLPPFLSYKEKGYLNLEVQLRAPVLASFKLQKPVDQLNASMLKLEMDIFNEIAVPNTTVVVTSLKPLAGSNWANVVFGVFPYDKHSTIPLTSLSLLRETFLSLVTGQSDFHLTPSLFGDPSFFQVLKFVGGITVIPRQNAFLLQRQSLFNFTLNFSIYQIQGVFQEFKDQLKSYLHLASYENLYVTLTNLQGSTLAPPVTVQASILLAVGNLPPSPPRLKQLAQTITHSPAGNLGLNHSVFGKVRQVQLSDFLQHTLNSGAGGGASSSPSPAPQPQSNHHHSRHYHHHHHHHEAHLAPAPAPVPKHSHPAPPPSGCQFHFPRKPWRKGHIAPSLVPAASPSPRPSATPRFHAIPPSHSHFPSASPLPAVAFTGVRPPSKSVPHVEPHDGTPSVSPSPSSCLSTVQWFRSSPWVFALLLSLLILLG